MNPAIIVINDGIIGKPEGSRLRESHEWNVNAEVLTSTHRDISDTWEYRKIQQISVICLGRADYEINK